MKKNSWPEWWDWKIEVTLDLLKHMEERNFDEVDLREMLQRSKSCRKDIVEGRWVIETRHERHLWEVVVEPDDFGKLLVVVTAYSV